MELKTRTTKNLRYTWKRSYPPLQQTRKETDMHKKKRPLRLASLDVFRKAIRYYHAIINLSVLFQSGILHSFVLGDHSFARNDPSSKGWCVPQVVITGHFLLFSWNIHPSGKVSKEFSGAISVAEHFKITLNARLYFGSLQAKMKASRATLTNMRPPHTLSTILNVRIFSEPVG